MDTTGLHNASQHSPPLGLANSLLGAGEPSGLAVPGSLPVPGVQVAGSPGKKAAHTHPWAPAWYAKEDRVTLAGTFCL